MIKNFCVDQSQININNAIIFFNVVLDYLVAEHIGDRFEIEDTRKSLGLDDPFLKKSWFSIRIIWKKNLFQGSLNGETVDKFKEIHQKQKEVRGHTYPFMHLRIFAGQEEVFGSFDYGSIIVLNFDDSQAEKFKEYLVKAGLPTSLIMPLENK